jgi:hypothetical protein
MKTFRSLLKSLGACENEIKWASDKPIEEVVATCPRGDWLLWLAQKIELALQIRTLAKGHCAATVMHLMKDERSINAVKTAIAFGQGRANIEELSDAFDAADDAADDAAAPDAASDAAAYCADAADPYAAPYSDEAVASAAAAGAAVAASRRCAAKIKNEKETADICRKYIGKLIIEKVSELLNTI